MLRKYALAFIAPHWRAIAGVVVLALIVSFLGVADPLVLKYLFDAIGDSNADAIPMALLLLCVVEVGRAGLMALLSVKTWDVRLAVDYSLRKQIVEKLTSTCADHHQVEGVGATMNKLTQSVASFTAAFAEIAFNLLPSIAYLVLALIAMCQLNWQMALVVIAFAPLPAVIGAWASKEQTLRERELMVRWTQIYSRLNEVLSSIRLVKIFAMEKVERERFLESQFEGNEIVAKGMRTDALTTSARGICVGIGRIAAIGVGTWFVLRGQLTLGSLVAFLGYVSGMFTPVQGLTTMYQTLRKGTVAVETMRDIFEARDEVPDQSGAHSLERVSGDLRFDNVTFVHRNGPVVLDEFNLHVKAGERVALVGPSGSGKTTLTNLLLRLYPVAAGKITVDGNDIRSITAHSLRRHIAYVAQEIHLFNDTVRANIAYARPGASHAEVEAAARSAHAHEFISHLPEGYDTIIGERGGRLSGGQRQRLAIARALLKDASILVMDEATSALDSVTESVVQQSIDKLCEGRTAIFAAHRLSTVVNADRIVVLKDGKVLASGTHSELLASNDYYAQLVGTSTGGRLALA
jgi:ATP-binding cassette, subfamily B, bacterial